MNKIVRRVKAPTPKFFKTIRTIGITLAAVGGAVIAAPVTLPTAIISVAGYLIVAGGVLSAVSQVTVEEDV